MQKVLAIAVAALIAAGLNTPAFASSCPKDMKAIDAALKNHPKLSAQQMSKIASLRAKGEAQHKSGDHKGSVKSLHQAMAILGIAK
ncbi:MAG: hypothetical protein H8E39_02345 [Alphaproteobacteria bacterium]|nr:hypothetical protein [Alphaproteobacteria bacterium]